MSDLNIAPYRLIQQQVTGGVPFSYTYSHASSYVITNIIGNVSGPLGDLLEVQVGPFAGPAIDIAAFRVVDATYLNSVYNDLVYVPVSQGDIITLQPTPGLTLADIVISGYFWAGD